MSSNQNCKFFVKRSNRNVSMRQRKASDDSSSSDEDTNSVVISDRKKRLNPMIQSTSSFSQAKKQRKDNQNDDKDEFDKHELISVSYSSSKTGEREGPTDMGATAIVETETEKDKDAQSIFERSLQINKELKGKEDDHVYRGINNYTQYIMKKDTPQGNASSGYVRKGPVRAPDNIRATVRWDYQPDLCKDYKETGFCGFGDSCVFLHDRTDYKAGWQIELEMSKGCYGEEDADKYKIDDDDDDLPFRCFICRDTFKSPVVTKCKHYFCEKCALDHYRKSTKCFVCGVQTMGVFNPAKEIIKKLKQDQHKHNDDDVGENYTEITHEENESHQDNDDEDKDDEDEDEDKDEDE